MEIISTVAVLRQRLSKEASVAFVPTMGNLHAGHLDLVRTALQQASCVVVSIFVNPLQFGANEDFGSYPRTLQDDCAKLAACGVAVVFAPTEADLYPQQQQVTVFVRHGEHLAPRVLAGIDKDDRACRGVMDEQS